jgi:hypothetical protein
MDCVANEKRLIKAGGDHAAIGCAPPQAG